MKTNPTRRLYIVGFLLLVVTLACRAGTPGDRPVSEGNPGESASTLESATINVVVEEFQVDLDAAQAKAGELSFVVRNEGNMPHDFAISGDGVEEKTPMLQPGETATLQVTLAPGVYQYICTVPGHAMLGMQGEFTVRE